LSHTSQYLRRLATGVFDATILRAGSITGRCGHARRFRQSGAIRPTTASSGAHCAGAFGKMLTFAALATTPAAPPSAPTSMRLRAPFRFSQQLKLGRQRAEFRFRPGQVARTMADLSHGRYGVVFDQAVAAAQGPRPALDRATGGNPGPCPRAQRAVLRRGCATRLDSTQSTGCPPRPQLDPRLAGGGAGRWGDWTGRAANLAAETYRHWRMDARLRREDPTTRARFLRAGFDTVHGRDMRARPRGKRNELRRLRATHRRAVDVTTTPRPTADPAPTSR